MPCIFVGGGARVIGRTEQQSRHKTKAPGQHRQGTSAAPGVGGQQPCNAGEKALEAALVSQIFPTTTIFYDAADHTCQSRHVRRDDRRVWDVLVDHCGNPALVGVRKWMRNAR